MRFDATPVLVSFLIPVYNEEATILEVLRRVNDLELEKQVIVVDDGSTDGTADALERWREAHPETVLVKQPHRGKGAALRAGIASVGGEIVVVQDADLEYDPADVPALIEPIVRGAADVVFGTRLRGGRPQRAHLFWHLVGNRALSLLTSILFNTTLSDIESGHKAFRADILRSLELRRDDFGIEAEIAAKAARRGLRIFELPVSYYGRTYAEGKKIRWTDGVKAVGVLLRERLRRG